MSQSAPTTAKPINLDDVGSAQQRAYVYSKSPTTIDEWLDDGRELLAETTKVQFRWGDWLQYGLEHWPAHAYQYAERMTGMSRSTLYDWHWVARNTPRELRRPGVPYTVYKELASRPPHVQRHFIETYISEGWDPQDLKDALALSAQQDLRPTEMTDEKKTERIVDEILQDVETEMSRRQLPESVRSEFGRRWAERHPPDNADGPAFPKEVECPNCHAKISPEALSLGTPQPANKAKEQKHVE